MRAICSHNSDTEQTNAALPPSRPGSILDGTTDSNRERRVSGVVGRPRGARLSVWRRSGRRARGVSDGSTPTPDRCRRRPRGESRGRTCTARKFMYRLPGYLWMGEGVPSVPRWSRSTPTSGSPVRIPARVVRTPPCVRGRGCERRDSPPLHAYQLCLNGTAETPNRRFSTR
jgi:hypothetical protein